MATAQIPQKPKLLLFDVNETLLDLSELKKKINEAYKSEFAAKQWFSLLLQYSLVDNVTDNYHDFKVIGKAALKMTAEKMEVDVPEEKMEEMVQMMRSMPPHPDVEDGLKALQQAGYRMATLTNNSHDVLTQQMEFAGLTNYFEKLMSIDSMRMFKPKIETYLKAVNQLGVKPEETMMIAAHGWDIAGARSAGLQAAFISRKGQALYPLAPMPQLTGKSLVDIAKELTNL